MPGRGLILAIESSCDETAAAVVERGARTLSSVVASQIATHARYGGVVPELASREHLRAIVPVVRAALAQAGVTLAGLDAIAVTSGPGLAGALLVGITYAKALAFSTGLPLIAVNHLEGHIHAVLLNERESTPSPLRGDPDEQALALVVSGGHTHLYLARPTANTWHYQLIGRTLDDAAGEAYDKVAKLLGFGYPGGPIIDKLAPFGNPEAVRFTSPKMKGNALDFSFSGLKTAVLRWAEQHDMADEIAARRGMLHAGIDELRKATPQRTLDLLASFQHAVVRELLRHVAVSAEEIGAQSAIISGGVACNAGLRDAARTASLPYAVFFPTPGLSTDNAAMIAAAAFPKLARREFADFTLKAKASMSLA